MVLTHNTQHLHICKLKSVAVAFVGRFKILRIYVCRVQNLVGNRDVIVLLGSRLTFAFSDGEFFVCFACT